MNPQYSILIVDDEENVRRMLSTAFSLEGQTISCAADGEQGLQRFRQQPPDVVLMDIRMPGSDGITTLQKMRALHQHIPIILMTAYAEVDTAVQALRAGAFDYVIKPFDLDELKMVIQRALELQAMKKEIRGLHRVLTDSWQWGHILTVSPCMMKICRDTEKIAQSHASVLISGESGTGKELIARAIHYNSRRASAPFIKVNCAALPESLLESVLFGHEKGAFTGAQGRHLGLFERAHQGTLLLDEIGEMPLNIQAKLLRVLQEREFERVGGQQTIKIDIRLVAASNQDLSAMVNRGEFRQDLYYRLNVIHLTIPPLRQRTADIALLANHFLHKFSLENQRELVDITPQALAVLQAWSWPGNVRELSNIIERAVIMSSGVSIQPEDLPLSLQQAACMPLTKAPLCNFTAQTSSQLSLSSFSLPSPHSFPQSFPQQQPQHITESSLKDAMKCYEKQLIITALEKNNGNRTHTALQLGISRRALMYKLQEHNIDSSTKNLADL